MATAHPETASPPESITLPQPDLEGKMTLEQALAQRRSVRQYAPGPLSLAEVSQLLWAAHGITGPNGKRTTPSARAVFPLEIWLAVGDVTDLAPGVYRYVPEDHALSLVAAGDPREGITAAAPRQAGVPTIPVVVAVVGDSALATERFGSRRERYLAMEAGFVVQDVYLQATALGLGTVAVGGYRDAPAREALGLPAGRELLLLMPVGRRK
jgi:SagB-type dehydrogenase family enzyme